MGPNLIEHFQWPFKSVLDTLPVALIKYHNMAYIEDRTACRWGLTAARKFLFMLPPQSRRQKGTGHQHRLQSLQVNPKDPILPIRLCLLSFPNISKWNYQLWPWIQILETIGVISYLSHNRSLHKYCKI